MSYPQSRLQAEAELQEKIDALRTVINALIEYGDHLPYCWLKKGPHGGACDCGRDQAVTDAKAILASATQEKEERVIAQIHSIRNGEVIEMEQFECGRGEFLTQVKYARDRALARGPWDDIRVEMEGSPNFVLVDLASAPSEEKS